MFSYARKEILWLIAAMLQACHFQRIMREFAFGYAIIKHVAPISNSCLDMTEPK
jgi:hypothetical protein